MEQEKKVTFDLPRISTGELFSIESESDNLTSFTSNSGQSSFTTIEQDLMNSLTGGDGKQDKSYFVSTFKLGEEHLNDFGSLDRREIERWKINEIENYNHVHSLKKRIKKCMKESLDHVYELFEFKDNLMKKLMVPLTVSELNGIVFLCSNMYLTFTKLTDLVCHMNRLLFVHDDGEDYDFIPFRLLMRHYVGLEKVIGGYEEKLQYTLNQIGVMTPELDTKRKLRDKLEMEHEKLLVHNGNLERSISKMSKDLAEGFVEKGKDMIKEFKEEQEQSKKQMKEIENLVETEISGMGMIIEDFEKQIAGILIHPDNSFSKNSQTTLYSMQIHVMHLSKRFQNLHRTVTLLQEKLKKMMKKKISGTQSKVREIQERKGYNLKMKFAKKHLEQIEKEVFPQLKTLGDILNRSEVPPDQKRRGNMLVKKNIAVLDQVNTVVAQILTPIHPKQSILNQLKNLRKAIKDEEADELDEILSTSKKKKKKKNEESPGKGGKKKKRKRKKLSEIESKIGQNYNRVKSITELEDGGFLSRQKHVKITTELYQKIKKMERSYEKKIRAVKAKLVQYEREEKRKKNKKALEKFKLMRKSRSGRIRGKVPLKSLVRPQSATSSPGGEDIQLPNVEISTVPIKSMDPFSNNNTKKDGLKKLTIHRKPNLKKNNTKDQKKKKKENETSKKDTEDDGLERTDTASSEPYDPEANAITPFLQETREDMKLRMSRPDTDDVIDLEQEGWMDQVMETAGIENVPNDSVFDLEKYYAEDEAYDGDIATIEEEGEEEGEYYSDEEGEDRSEYSDEEGEDRSEYSDEGSYYSDEEFD